MGGKSIGSLTQGWLTAEVAVIKEGVASWVGGGKGGREYERILQCVCPRKCIVFSRVWVWGRL